MEYIFIYLLQIFDRIDIFRIGCWFLTIFTLIPYIALKLEVMANDANCKEFTNIEKLARKILISLFSLALIFSFIPTKQTLLLIGGTYIGKKTVNQVVTDEKIKKIDTIINLELDKRIKELKENK